MAQMGSRETEEKVSIKPRAVAQAGATRPLTRLSGDQFTTENRKVAFRRQSTTVKPGLDTGPYVVNAKTYCMSQFTLIPLTRMYSRFSPRILLHSTTFLQNHKQESRTHSAHSWGEVFPAQFEDEQGVLAGHVSDVASEAFGSCG